MCFLSVWRGSTDNKDCYCLDRGFGFLPVMRLRLAVLNTDLEVKVLSVTTREQATDEGESAHEKSCSSFLMLK